MISLTVVKIFHFHHSLFVLFKLAMLLNVMLRVQVSDLPSLLKQKLWLMSIAPKPVQVDLPRTFKDHTVKMLKLMSLKTLTLHTMFSTPLWKKVKYFAYCIKKIKSSREIVVYNSFLR